MGCLSLPSLPLWQTTSTHASVLTRCHERPPLTRLGIWKTDDNVSTAEESDAKESGMMCGSN